MKAKTILKGIGIAALGIGAGLVITSELGRAAEKERTKELVDNISKDSSVLGSSAREIVSGLRLKEYVDTFATGGLVILVNGKGYNENKEKLMGFAEAHDISYCFLKTCNGVELKDSTGEDSIYLNFGRILVDESSKPYKGDIDTSVCCLVNDQLVYDGACARDKSNRIKVYDDEHNYSVDIEGDIRYITNSGRYEKRWIVDADENVIGLMFSFVG